ncbi:MAG: DUF4249 domain-containing protein [Bacteroidia bacterium]|nr:DUF4249 domain-containing protein [Bacteroidia bacterium]
MKKIKTFTQIIIATIALSSCEKVIDLDLKDVESKLVVEANITNQPGPYFVKLTKSIPFDESSIYPEVNDALVIISDEAGQSDTLNYTSNGVYKTNTTQGIEGRSYYLKIVAEGKTYTATSTMPQKVILDNIGISVLQFGGQNNNVLFPEYTDPIKKGNNYNFVVTINGVKNKTYLLWNDNTNNGLPNQRPIGGPGIDIKTGDNVIVEMQCIDSNVYDYYFTLSQMAGNGPGGGTTPTNPPNNITGGALGLFSAHTTESKDVIVP